MEIFIFVVENISAGNNRDLKVIFGFGSLPEGFVHSTRRIGVKVNLSALIAYSGGKVFNQNIFFSMSSHIINSLGYNRSSTEKTCFHLRVLDFINHILS